MKRKKWLFAIATLWMVTAVSSGATGSAATVSDSVVKIVTQYNRFNWYEPWASGSTGRGTGSGFVIRGKRILTNAHVVSDAAIIVVFFHNDPNPYIAYVESIGHDCDLAVLRLKNEERLAKVPPLEFGGLPPLRSRVVTYGYPAGGRLLSSTVGVVSRIESQIYVHSGVDEHLAVQTDAAINPGNSGGPVLWKDKVVGVAFQASRQLENMGFFIPVQVIRHFLTDLEDGSYDGFPELGILAAPLENPAAHAFSGLKDEETGVRIDYIFKGCSGDGVLRTNDVITSIAGMPVANDGTIEWHGLRLELTFAVDERQVGEELPLTILRDGKPMKLSVKLLPYNPARARGNIYDTLPRYYIYGGLVFVPLNRATLETYDNWLVDAPQELVYEYYFRPLLRHDYLDAPRVMQIRRLDDAVNVEEENNNYRVVDSVNGQKVRTLEDLVRAFEGNQTNRFQVIRFRYGNRITVLDREKAEAANPKILKRYAIPKDHRL